MSLNVSENCTPGVETKKYRAGHNSNGMNQIVVKNLHDMLSYLAKFESTRPSPKPLTSVPNELIRFH